MDVLRRLLRRVPAARVADPEDRSGGPDEPAGLGGLGFRDLIRELGSPDERQRQDVALLLSGLGYRGAIRPLIRAYVRHGDPVLLDALRPFGARLTTEAARELRDESLSPAEKGRVMDVLAASGDLGAISILRPIARTGEMEPHLAACAALAELDDREGVDLLDDDLLRLDRSFRAGALRALSAIDSDAARAAVEEHVRRYLSGGRAIPADILVTMPMLIEPDGDLAEMTARYVRENARRLTVVTGPGIDGVAEWKRDVLARRLPAHRIVYSTPRHSPDEQIALLVQARDAAAREPAARVAVVGRLPSPAGRHPLPHFLTRPGGQGYSARVILVGPQKPSLVIEWWHYLVDHAEVPADMVVVLTTQVLGHSELTDEELMIQELAGPARRDEFARAVLAHL